MVGGEGEGTDTRTGHSCVHVNPLPPPTRGLGDGWRLEKKKKKLHTVGTASNVTLPKLDGRHANRCRDLDPRPWKGISTTEDPGFVRR